MPQVIVPALAGGLGIASGTLGYALLQIGTSLVLSSAAKALMPKPDNGGLRGRQVSMRQPVAPREMVYGYQRKGGIVVFMESGPGSAGTADEDLHLVIVLATHQVHAIGSIYFNGEEAVDFYGNVTGRFVGWLEAHKALGSVSQPAFARLMEKLPSQWTQYHRLAGCAAIYLRLVANPDVYAQGVPNIVADVWGKNDIYDPRTLSSGYSANPSLCLADYMANSRFGVGAGIGAENGIHSARLAASATICDELVAKPGGGTEARYSCNGVVDLSQTPQTVIEAMLSSMAGTAAWHSGQWHIRAGAYEAPTLTFTADDVAGDGILLQTRRSRSENFNGVRGQFVSPENDWQPDDFPAYQSATYLAEDGGDEAWADITLPFTTSAATAQRLAKIALERQRRQMSVTMTGKMRTWRAAAGETVNLTYDRWGFAAKPFEIRQLQLAIGGSEGAPVMAPELALQETSPLVYDSTASEFQIYAAAPRTNLPSPFDILPPRAVTVAESLYSTRPGAAAKVRATVSWQPSLSTWVEQYQVETSVDGVTWTPHGRTTALSFDIDDITPGVRLFGVRAISNLNVSSPREFITQEIYGLAAPPAALQNVTLQTAGGLAVIKWTQVTDIDVLSGGSIVIRHSTAASPTWATSVSMDIVAGNCAIAAVPLKPGSYLIRAEDSSGIAGPVTVVSTDGAQALAFGPLSSLQAEPTWAGTLTDVFIDTGTLKISSSSLVDSWADWDAISNVDAEGGIKPQGTYQFATGIDLTAVKRARIRSVIGVDALDVAGSMDARPGDVDSWVSFDGPEGGEIDVVAEIRLTNDDPAGSPTWGAWQRVDNHEASFRGLQARAVLRSFDPGVTPVLSKLQVKVEEVI